MAIAMVQVSAQENDGGEIVNDQTFAEGMMVTRVKMVPLSGTVTNIFFVHCADEPWNGLVGV